MPGYRSGGLIYKVGSYGEVEYGYYANVSYTSSFPNSTPVKIFVPGYGYMWHLGEPTVAGTRPVWIPLGTSNLGIDSGKWRIYDLSDRQIQAMNGITGTLGLLSLASLGDLPILSAAIHKATLIPSTLVMINNMLDYRDIQNPLPSDNAKIALNLTNYLLGTFWMPWTIPSALVSEFDLTGGFDNFYNYFNDLKQYE